ncbi:hypothetical protein FJY71_00730 [candidate division WOR-3 bacterium]|nr:hypothetical protein [candidate division WOR-3 bacterium]
MVKTALAMASAVARERRAKLRKSVGGWPSPLSAAAVLPPRSGQGRGPGASAIPSGGQGFGLPPLVR